MYQAQNSNYILTKAKLLIFEAGDVRTKKKRCIAAAPLFYSSV